MLEAASPIDKFRIFEDALVTCWPGVGSTHRAVRYALAHLVCEPHSSTIGTIIDELGLSPRRFIQVFSEQVGMTPKLFCRVRRFQRALSQIQRLRDGMWADLAAECGYYDQAHFISDFKEFCGITPSQYFKQAPEYPNFVPIVS